MQEARFFQSTRGKIVEALRRRHTASALELAAEFGLSANAVRQHLVVLERDAFVAERPVKRGRTKPTFEYSLTKAGEALFPQHYDRMLGAVLRQVRSSFGDDAVRSIFEGIGQRQGSLLRRKTEHASDREKVEAVVEGLRESGVDVDLIEVNGALELREHNCPYANTVAEHPEVCSAIHSMMDEILPGVEVAQVESLATGGATCRFDIRKTTVSHEGSAP
ncbi:MAG TPA: helix-turn-helix domain-containing protein [Candidatus Baltobacteraceae bacterium]|jgi:predicted ArsR family transcriptional regulator|nr:helix-turn-helix domain-containing protein [Candidatus Baltobacteraceae bacterium]